jgi:hypothetical protein
MLAFYGQICRPVRAEALGKKLDLSMLVSDVDDSLLMWALLLCFAWLLRATITAGAVVVSHSYRCRCLAAAVDSRRPDYFSNINSMTTGVFALIECFRPAGM